MNLKHVETVMQGDEVIVAWRKKNPNMQIDLTGADLTGADLTGADLTGADLSGADLSGANLRWTDLTGADLPGADLSGADLSGANLRWTDLTGANLRWTDLTGADLTGADLTGADLTTAICILLLPIVDPRGYQPVAQIWKGKLVITAGCRRFTIHEAHEHWGSPDYPNRELGDIYLAGLDWLETDEGAQIWVASERSTEKETDNV